MKTNPNFVLPKVFFIGSTVIDFIALNEYLSYTDQEEFKQDIDAALLEGISHGEILTSFYAKACYASLTDKKNKNISKTRSIGDNVLGTIDSGHGSVFEHVMLNFMITECSRVFTHEQVRHRVGTAFSQTSGRYVRSDVLKMIVDPILKPIIESGHAENGRKMIEDWYNEAVRQMDLDNIKDFGIKKKITSALRRWMPNGQANEMGHSCNLRTLRQTIQARTDRQAEWEIRLIYNQIAELVKAKFGLLFSDASYELVNGLNEITFKNKKI